MKYSELKKQFIASLRGVGKGRRSLHTLFSDWLEIAAIALHQLPYQSGDLAKDSAFESFEKNYLERIKPYSREELNAFSKLLHITTFAHHIGYGDFLGEIASEAELLNRRGGQFFTPYHLCRAMAKMTFGDVKAHVEEKGLLLVAEPASGSGALVIASAEEIASQGVHPCSCVQFDCTDISRDAFNMAYIQLSALGLQAVVRHGNTLSMEFWENRPTPQLRLFDKWLKQKQRSIRLEKALRDLLMLGDNSRNLHTSTAQQKTAVASAEPMSQQNASSQDDSLPVRATLFDLDAFSSGGTKRDRRRCKADVVLRNEQMELPLES
ncbi:MAG: N-6 DNA methylase [Cyanobacteria bacterium J06643_4]